MVDLRTRQRALAKETILDACADLVTARHHLDFSMKEVADLAGVSLRTVYNHFATREDLLDALARAMNDEMAARGGADAAEVETFDELLDAIRRNAQVFEELDGVSQAIAQLPLADVGLDSDRQARTARIVDHFVAAMPNVPADEARAIGLVLRHLLSHRSWFWLTREYGLTVEQFADITTWAVQTLVSAAEAGDLPVGREET